MAALIAFGCANCFSASAADGAASAELYGFYGNGMLFQQNEAAVFSGTGTAGAQIKCTLLDSSGEKCAEATAAVDNDGSFAVEFTAPAGGYSEYTAVLYCNGVEFKRITKIVFGELWLSSGQSNMQMGVGGTEHWSEMAQSGNYGSSWVRFLQVPVEPTVNGEKTVPYSPCNNIEGAYWVIGGSSAVSGVSAVSYFFANELSEKLDMPVGVLSVSLGGTPIRSWISRDWLEGSSKAMSILDEHEQYISQSSWYSSERSYYTDMTGNYNAKVYPLRNFKISGMIWYQGETELLTNCSYKDYTVYFDLMQENYTRLFGLSEELPIIYTHLACFNYRTNTRDLQSLNAEFTEIQQLKPESRAVTAISDVPLNFELALGSIHPTVKQPIGLRMAESAMGLVYGAEGPYTVASLKSYKIEGKYVYMSFNDVGDGLACNGSTLRDFAVCASDKVYYPAQAEIVSADTVRVWNDEIEAPIAATYAYSQGNYRANLYSTKNGQSYMPVSPAVTSRLDGAEYYYDLPWADCEQEEYFRNASDEAVTGNHALWNTENCTYVIDKNSAHSGDAGLKITAQNECFSVNVKYAYYEGDKVIRFNDASRDWRSYGVLRFWVRNAGESDITLKNVRLEITNGIWFAAELNGSNRASLVIPADGEWHCIEADLNELYLVGDDKTLGFTEFVTEEIFALQLDFEGDADSSVELDSFVLAPAAESKEVFEFDFAARALRTVYVFIKSAFQLIFNGGILP